MNVMTSSMPLLGLDESFIYNHTRLVLRTGFRHGRHEFHCPSRFTQSLNQGLVCCHCDGGHHRWNTCQSPCDISQLDHTLPSAPPTQPVTSCLTCQLRCLRALQYLPQIYFWWKAPWQINQITGGLFFLFPPAKRLRSEDCKWICLNGSD